MSARKDLVVPPPRGRMRTGADAVEYVSSGGRRPVFVEGRGGGDARDAGVVSGHVLRGVERALSDDAVYVVYQGDPPAERACRR